MTLKIGIFSFAHMHAQSYADAITANPGAALAGVWDADALRGQAMAELYKTTFYASERELTAQGLDGAIVTSENVYHQRLVEIAAEAGVKAILCEKPLSTTVANAQSMIDYCATRNVKLATAFPCRYSPAFQSLLRQVKAGAVGKVLAIRGANRGKAPGGWFVDKALSGGGAVIDHTVHAADLNWLLLGQNATEVYAETGNEFTHADSEDTGFLTISYDGGVFATLDTSWSCPKNYPTWGDVTLQVVGTEGVIDADLFAQNLVCYDASAGNASWSNWGSGTDSEMVADFLRLLTGEDAPRLATGEDGLRAVQIALTAYESAALGQPVALVDGN